MQIGPFFQKKRYRYSRTRRTFKFEFHN